MNFKKLQKKFDHFGFELTYEGNIYKVRRYGHIDNEYECKGREKIEVFLEELMFLYYIINVES